MKILKTLTDVELVIVDLEVTLGEKKQNAPTLCELYYKEKYQNQSEQFL